MEKEVHVSHDDFGRFLQTGLPNNECVEVFFQEDNILIKRVDFSEFEDRLNLVVWEGRDGVRLFGTYLEHEHYPPYSPQEKDFKFVFCKWNDMIWNVCSLPLSDESKANAEDAAKYAGFRLADGVPCLIASGALTALGSQRPNTKLEEHLEFFPIQTDNTYNLEYQRDSVAYEGFGGQQDIKNAAEYKLNKFLEEKGIEL